ncbi:GSCOCG00009249001-RA-CDS [Cotesia congregata]|nr:GSCOCG00009249001-RA-CDS [Cotesia congregata]
MLASLADSTLKQYQSVLQQRSEFCTRNELDLLEPDSHGLLRFLTEKQKKGASYSGLNTLRSAVSLIAGVKIGADPLVSRLMKGAFKLKPSTPKYKDYPLYFKESLELQNQIKFIIYLSIYPLENLSLTKLSHKLVTLLALCTAHRAQTLASIEVKNITVRENALEIKIAKLIKTSGPGRAQPLLVVPFFKEKPELCVATTLNFYVKKTKTARGKLGNLFISTVKPLSRSTVTMVNRLMRMMK